jgi:ribose 5-phosphate isomerase B
MEVHSLKIALGSDHLGFGLKNYIAEHLRNLGIEFRDFGVHSEDPVDYPDIAVEVCEAIAAGDFDRGILICGTGLGMAIAANKVPGIRAGACHDIYSAERLKKSNDGQVLTLGSRVIGKENAVFIVDAWLNSEFEGRSVEKVRKLKELDQKKVTS